MKRKTKSKIKSGKTKTTRSKLCLKIDRERLAMPPGRRKSYWGNIYYESRVNRSDKSPKSRI